MFSLYGKGNWRNTNIQCLAEGDWWTDEYNVRPIGVLSPPEVIISTPAQGTWNRAVPFSENVSAADGEIRKSSDSWVVLEP